MSGTTILILAAGSSVRMRGTDKLVQAVDGVAQLRRIAVAALSTGCPVLVALPQDNAARNAALSGLPVEIVIVTQAAEGMAASIRAGASRVGAGRALMIVPADMPTLEAADLVTMISAQVANPDAILRGSDVDVDGHPVVFPSRLIDKLQELKGDEGARRLIGAEGEHVIRVVLPEGHACLDLDTPEDWAVWLHEREVALPTPPGEEMLHPSMRDPLYAALRNPDQAVLAVITGVSGASYRKTGAMMALFGDGQVAGSLTNGCIEADLAIHAAKSLANGTVTHLRYGEGSPFFDIRLPCGGGLDIALYPRPDAVQLRKAKVWRAERRFFSLRIDPLGTMMLQDSHPTGWLGRDFVIDARPDVRFVIYGDGPEAVLFTRLVQSAGYAQDLFTTSSDTCLAVAASGINAQYHGTLPLPDPTDLDARTAVLTFFHDHELEIPILAAALGSSAFYVGAQGSRKVAARQRERLRDLGISAEHLSRYRSPIGVIPSARDPRTLAISVLAEVIKLSADAD